MKQLILISICLIHTAGNAAVLKHSYLFDNGFTDSTGSLAIVGNGGTVNSGRYDFAPNQGLTLTGGLDNTSDYSIEITMAYDSLNPRWNKLIDFQNLASDFGVYFDFGQVQFFPDSTNGSDSIQANTDFNFVLTRDSSETKGYLNGVLQWTILSSASSVPSANILTFVTDDTVTPGSTEAQSGLIDFIRIYDGALTASEVDNLTSPSAVPVPGAVWFFLSGLVGLFCMRNSRVNNA